MGRPPRNVKGTKATKGPNYVPKADRYCIQCDREFVRPCEYIRHIKYTLLHNPEGARRYPCPLCSKKFTHFSNLYNHQRTHTGEFEICGLPLGGNASETCRRRYTDIPNLRKHMNRDHLDYFTKAGLLVPLWLEDAHKHRKLALSEKHGRKLGDKKQEPVAEISSPSDSPLVTPSPEPNPFVQIYNADTMEPLRSQRIAKENNLHQVWGSVVHRDEAPSVHQPPDVHFLEFELDLLNFGNTNQSAVTFITYDMSTPISPAYTGISSAAQHQVFEPSPLTDLDVAGLSLGYHYDIPIAFFAPTGQSTPTDSNVGTISYGASESFNGFQTYQPTFFPDVVSGVFPQLQENLSFPDNQELVVPQSGSVDYFNADDQTEINLFNYSQFTGDETLIPPFPSYSSLNL